LSTNLGKDEPFGRGVGGEEDLLLRGTGHRAAATGHHLLEPQS
jgi:hypothetical protein